MSEVTRGPASSLGSSQAAPVTGEPHSSQTSAWALEPEDTMEPRSPTSHVAEGRAEFKSRTPLTATVDCPALGPPPGVQPRLATPLQWNRLGQVPGKAHGADIDRRRRCERVTVGPARTRVPVNGGPRLICPGQERDSKVGGRSLLSPEGSWGSIGGHWAWLLCTCNLPSWPEELLSLTKGGSETPRPPHAVG